MQKYFSVFFLLLFLLLPVGVSAATVLLQATPVTLGVGDVLRVSLLLDSPTATNAFSGELVYPTATLEPISISDGNSIVSMWVTRPTTNKGSAITFAGITPGGFSGEKGVLFSIMFRATAADTVKISLKDLQVLRNDGKGTVEPVVTKTLTFSVGSKSSGGYIEPVDQDPPELFTALGGADPQLFEGKSYIVFTAVDKGSGVDHYRLVESRIPPPLLRFFPAVWSEVTSPYVLTDQGLTTTIYIKAVDRFGNERLSIYPPQHLFTPYEKVVLLAILIGVALLWYQRWGRRRRS